MWDITVVLCSMKVLRSSLLCDAAERVLFAVAKFLVLLRVLSASSHEVQIGTSYVRWGRKTCESNASLVYTGSKCKKTVVYTRVNGASHIENCKNYKKVITHQHIA